MQTEELEPIERLTKDLKEAAITLSDDEARFLVDAYYAMQENRKRTDNQVRALNTAASRTRSSPGWPSRTLDLRSRSRAR
jgi:hypothetical protein